MEIGQCAEAGSASVPADGENFLSKILSAWAVLQEDVNRLKQKKLVDDGARLEAESAPSSSCCQGI